MPAGRPTRYSLGMCDKVIELGKEGMSLCEIADALDITRATLYNWMDQHEEFLDSIKRAREAAQAWWERTGRAGLFADKFNAQVWKKSVESRFPDDYREHKQVELSGSISTITRKIVDPAHE